MALQASLSTPAGKDGVTATLAATTATASAITIGQRAVFAISVHGTIGTNGVGVTITFGLSSGTGPTTPSATVGFQIPMNTTQIFDLGTEFDQFKLYNATSAIITYSYLQISKF